MRSPLLKKITILSHECEGTSTVCDFLAAYLRTAGDPDVLFARFPFVYSKDGAIRLERRERGRDLPARQSWIRFYQPAPLSYAKDFVYALIYGLRFGRGSDLAVGTTNLLALAGLWLRRLGWVKKAVYVMIDYTPRRYENPILNWLYYRVDRMAAGGCDQVWTLSEAMIEGRFRDGRLNRERVRYAVVPFGNNSDLMTDADLKRYDATRIVYFGGVIRLKGAELFAPILKALADKGRGDLTLTCIGAGDLDDLRTEAVRLGVSDRVKILGPVADHHVVERHLLECAVAIAPYSPEDRNSYSFFADPGKVKTYLGCALPIVITDVPPIAAEIGRQGAGLVAAYGAQDIAAKVLKILETPQSIREYRERAFSMGKQYSWSAIFSKALKGL